MYTSQGMQPKWCDRGFWYKVDLYGYEALAENIVSLLLEYSGCANFVYYDIIKVNYNGRYVNACISEDFLLQDEIYVPCADFVQHITTIQDFVDTMISVTKLDNFGIYLSDILYLDAVILNEDRHLNNIGVIYNKRLNTYSLAPVFDNGASLSSNLTYYPFGLSSSDTYMGQTIAKPFYRNFQKQVDEVTKLYGRSISLQFDYDIIRDNIQNGFYPDNYIHRCLQVINKRLHSVR